MKILLVGAGAVGQVYGRHLQKAGHDVSFLVKEKYEAEARGGYVLYPLNESGRRCPVRFEGFGVLVRPAGGFDQVWLCFSSTALRGPLTDEIARTLGAATLICLQPGVDDRDYLAARVPSDQIVSGLISLISYQAPLPGEVVPAPGVAYWFPPMGPSLFDGEPGRTKTVVDALRGGGCPARKQRQLAVQGGLGGAILMPILLALEGAGWTFAGVRRSPLLPLAVAAARESATVVAAGAGVRPPAALRLLCPNALRLVSRVAPHVIPLDVETYLEYHFTKVGDQTRFMVETYLRLGRERGIATPALATLARQVLEGAFR